MVKTDPCLHLSFFSTLPQPLPHVLQSKKELKKQQDCRKGHYKQVANSPLK